MRARVSSWEGEGEGCGDPLVRWGPRASAGFPASLTAITDV